MKTPVLMVNAIAVLIGVSYGMLDPVFPIFARFIGASYAEVGLLSIADTLPYAFIPVLVGFLLYRYNNGRLLFVGIILNVASIFLLSYSGELWHVVILICLAGVGYAFFWPPCINIIENLSDNPLRGRVILHGCFAAGTVAGPFIGAVLFTLDASYGAIFQAGASILAAGMVLCIPVMRSRVSVSEMRLSFSSLAWVARFPVAVCIILYCSACLAVVFTLHPVFLSEHHIREACIELVYFVLAVSRILTLVVARRLARSNYVMAVAVFSMAAGMAGSYFSDTAVEFAVSIIFLGIGISTFYPIALEVILVRTTRALSAVVIGTYEAIIGIGWIAGAVSAGIMYELYGGETFYTGFAVLGVLIGVLALYKRRTLGTRAPIGRNISPGENA